MTEGDVILSYRGVTVAFGAHVVLERLDLDVVEHETIAVLGPSGVGKSVLLRVTIGLLRPDEGEVRFRGRNVAALGEDDLREVRRHFGVVFQAGALFDSLTVAENVAYPLREHERWGEPRIQERVAEVLSLVGLDAGRVGHLLPGEISGGMRKRVALARAVALAPEVILYDEPTTGLDPANVLRADTLIQQMQRQLGVTSIVITHDIESAFRVADRMAFLQRRHIEWIGASDVARRSPPDALRRFLEGVEAA